MSNNSSSDMSDIEETPSNTIVDDNKCIGMFYAASWPSPQKYHNL